MNKKRICKIRHFSPLLLLFCMLLTTQAFAQNQRVTIQMTDAPMERVINSIERQTTLLFVIGDQVDINRRVNVVCDNAPIREALDQMVKGADVTYNISGSNIVLAKRTQPRPQGSVTITCRVLDEQGQPVIAATAVVRGTTTAAISDIDGKVSLTVPAPAAAHQLEISYLGYETKVVTIGDRTSFDVTLTPLLSQLDEVVVTALGIRREQRALSYNVQQVKAAELTSVKSTNLVNSLAGKVAGAAINASSSGVGGAAKVVLRGVKSIEQSNNALYVVDGIPMYNFAGSGEMEFGSRGTTEAIADINPDDIESVSVLTGAAAAALYGSSAANGAVIVTTKRGEAGKTKVSLSSNTEFLTPFVMPRFQNRYGTGSKGATGGSTIMSWGAKLNEATRTGYSPREFFETGVVTTNSVSVSGGSERNQSFLSAASVNSEGMIPNNAYNRYNFNFRNVTSMLDDRLTLDVSASYILQNDRNMTNQGLYSNPLVSAYLFPRGDDFSLVKAFERWDPVRGIPIAYWPQGKGSFEMQNPYWVAYRNLLENDKKRYMLSASASYKVFDWLDVMGRVRIDNTNNMFEQKLYASSNTTITEGSSQGHYTEQRTNDGQVYADALANINKRWDDWSIVANIGASISDNRSDMVNYDGPIREDLIPNVFTVFQLDKTKSQAVRNRWREQTQSVFGSVEVGWKSMLYLTLTGRNDWASQLAGSPQNSFFYPSVGASALLSEMLEMPQWVDMVKVRGSFSSVGTPFPRHLTNPTYEYDQVLMSWKPKTHYPIGQLYPERTNSWELGLDVMLWRDFRFSASYYRAGTMNQTFDPKITVSSGYSTLYVQTGHVRNVGLEALVGYGHTWGDFRWETSYTLGWNKNTIVELVKDYTHPQTLELISKDRLEVKGLGKAKFILKEGGSIGDLYSNSRLKSDVNGMIEVDNSGNLVTLDNYADMKLGSVLPDYNMSWGNSFSWRGFHASALISARLGGIVYSATQAALDQHGVSEASAAARDAGGVMINGRSMVDSETWFTAISSSGGLPQYYTYDATNVRLAEAYIGYTLPAKWFGEKLGVTVSLVGRNLVMIYNKAPFDPESVATTGNFYQGIDYFMTPATRNLGFNIKLNF